MAPSTGKTKYKHPVSVFILAVCLFQLPSQCKSRNLNQDDISIRLSHQTEVGSIVLIDTFDTGCTEYDHIQRISKDTPEVFKIHNEERLVVNLPLHNYIGDLFIIKTKPSRACLSSVSHTKHISIEIAKPEQTMSFTKNIYHGTIRKHSPSRTLVQGLDDLYACSPSRCSSNVDYRIVGETEFYLQTINVHGKIILQIASRTSMMDVPKNRHNFIIVAENVDGLIGHTNIQIDVGTHIPNYKFETDETLRYLPKVNSQVALNPLRRSRRATQQTLPKQQIPETESGILFQITDTSATVPVNYTLVNSTRPNTFVVSPTGSLSLAPDANWDYEYFRDRNIPTTMRLTIEVKQISDGIVLRELIQEIEITDVNDENPMFTNKPNPYLATVSVNAPGNTLVYSLTAMDPDQSANLELVALFTPDPSAANLFRVTINGNRADIYTSNSGGLTLNQEYFVDVRATDLNSNPQQVTTARVAIKAGERAPQFMETSYIINFREKNAPNQVINPYPITVRTFQETNVAFEILNQDLQLSTYFTAETDMNQNGQLRNCSINVIRVMDYERDPSEYRAYIQARELSTGFSSSVTLTVNLLDWNEFDPRFTVSTYATPQPVPENIAVGASVMTVTASDMDKNTKLSFWVDDDHFSVASTDPDSTVNPHTAVIRVAKPLDYDHRTVKMYDFQVYAQDDGTSPKARTGQATVRITLKDLNDEHPVFEGDMNANLRFDAPVGREVYVVKASDADSGDGVTYRFRDSNPKFALESSSGRITLAQTIANSQDTISQFIYNLVVIATDDGQCCGGGTFLSSTGTVTVNILTDNLNPPKFTVCLTFGLSVDEGSEVNRTVGQVVATDDDNGANGEVTYSILELDGKFWINTTSGEIYTRRSLDREDKAREVVNVIATDGGNQKAYCTLFITITDINDNTPSFLQQSYTFSILRTLAIGDVAGTVEARDQDIGINSEIEYILFSNPGDYFTVQAVTGVISVNNTLPQQDTQNINLLMQARDKGVPPLHSNASITMTLVTDPTLLPPEWLGDPQYQVEVAENIPQGSSLYTLRARPRTSNPTLTFGIIDVDGSPSTDMFILRDGPDEGDVKTSILQLTGNFDYETKKQFIVTVKVTDTSGQFLSADKRVTITVTDVNDNQPFFLGLNENFFIQMSLLEQDYSRENKLVGTVIAKDNDGPPLNNLIESYRINDPRGDFTINAQTGQIFTSGNFDRETETQRTFRVEAIDGANSSLTGVQGHNTGAATVLVIIEDRNDNPPTFPQDIYMFEVNEDSPIGYVVGQTKASDLDSAAVLRYSLIPSNIPFTIQSQTANIQVGGPLDYDAGQKEYNFQVKVDDSSFTSTSNVTVKILNVNDNPPVVASYTFDNITENDMSVVGRPLVKVAVTDVDDNNGPFYYSLEFTDKQIDSQYFEINANGEVFIIKALDRDYPNGKAEFKFQVLVSDEDPSDPNASPLVGYGIITVRPIDVNDNEPFFPAEHLNMTVPENKPIGTSVGRVEVEDYDDPNTDNSVVDISIEMQTPEPAFKLEDGFILKTTKVLDREVLDRYEVRIRAVDRGNPTKSGFGTIVVSVEDENDNIPFFNTSYRFQLSEHQLSGEVGRIQAYDKDIGANARLTYSLGANDVTYFKMDQDNNQGVLKIYQPVDYDDLTNLQRSFNLTAFVVDTDITHMDNTYIEVEVTDYNDETPTFDPAEQSITVPENVMIGTFLRQFNATDRDVDPEFGRFEYYISLKSDPLRQFSINTTGHVKIQHSLDREEHDVHIVHILAIDNVNGDPQNTGTGTLTVTVTDINDNYPDFAGTYAPIVQENFPYSNEEIVEIMAVDADIPTNGAPFSFELRCSDPKASTFCSSFSVTYNEAGDGGKGSAVLRASGEFDRENDAGEKILTLPIFMCDLYNMGRSDQQCGIRYLYVTIGDKNDNIHTDANQYILVYNYKGLFGNFKIGTVTVNDPDDKPASDKVFYLQNQNITGYFIDVNQQTGEITLKNKVPEMAFTVQVLVRDQSSNTATTTIIIDVVYIPEDAVYNSGSIRIKDITAEDFIRRTPIAGSSSMYDKFREQLAQQLYGSTTPSQLDKVQVLSVMNGPSNPDNEKFVDVRFAAHGSPYYQSSRLDGIVSSNKTQFNNVLKTAGATYGVDPTLDMVPIDMCKFETCEGGCFNNLIVSSDSPEVVDTQGASFVGVKTEVQGQCGCRAKEITGDVACTPGYCYHGGTCTQDDFGVVSCQCPDGFDGPRCQQLRQTFDGTGYALYRQLEQCEESRTSLEILTRSSDALLMYNGPISELSQTDPRDFILLELQNGYPKLRINHGTGEALIEIPNSNQARLNDNTWHRIDIIRKRKAVTLMVDNCVKSSMSQDGTEDRSSCEGEGYTKGENIYVNVPQVLQLGGRMASPSYPPGVTSSKYEGCIKNLMHNGQLYDLSTGGQFDGANDGCPAEDDKCGTEGCGNGKCLVTGPSPNHWMCDCDSGSRPAADKRCTDNTTMVNLKQNSYMDWSLKQAFYALIDTKQMKLLIHVRTRQTSGTIFSVTDSNNNNGNKFITLLVEDMYLKLSYNLGNGPYSLILNNVKFSDGQWHKVSLERYGKSFIMQMDGGEGRYYADTAGPVGGDIGFTIIQNQVHAGASLRYSGSSATLSDDLQDSCLNDIRMDHSWFPMIKAENADSSAANLENIINTDPGCSSISCVGKCIPPKVCVPLWDTFKCDCPEHYVENINSQCIPYEYCRLDSPCFGGATCIDNVPPGLDENPFICNCPPGWYGPLCQCHASLDSDSDACRQEGEEDEAVGVASGLIIGIVLGILFLIVAVIIIAFLLYRRCGPEPGKGELLDDDDMDDIRENVMYYDEEGAGEEDQTQYDLSRLRKPDMGEHPGPWDSPDIPEKVDKLGSRPDRPDIGDFINGRLNDADDDPSSPPYDTPQKFEFEGGSSDAGSLSSLNTSSSGSQDYDYLSEWGPKFKKLADMYNNYDDAE